jgi:acetyl esterase/lipase
VISFFTQISLAQTSWNQVEIYSDINYYPDNVTEDIPKNAHLLDIYKPDGCHCCPVIIYIHGGYWVMGDKGSLSDKAKAFTSNNYLYISINYRLSPDYQFPAHAHDVAHAFYWVKNNISNYGGNPEQIYLLGHSAGGQLAALMALDEHYLAEFGLTPSDIAGIIGVDSAGYHLPSLYAAEPENRYLISWAFGDELEDWEAASPFHYVKAGKIVPPFLLLVAGGRKVSEEVNKSFYQRLKDDGYRANILYFEDKDHVSIDYELGADEDRVFPAVLNWLKEH